MPDKTIYSLTDKGKEKLLETLEQSILSFDYDTNVFSIAAFFIDILENREELLNKRLVLLNNYKVGIEKQLKVLEDNTSLVTLANIERSKLIVEAEILGTKKFIVCNIDGKVNKNCNRQMAKSHLPIVHKAISQSVKVKSFAPRQIQRRYLRRL